MARPPLPSPVLLPPAPDDRLLAAAELIRSRLHADIGSDHATLPLWLLHTERAERVIIVEKTTGPLEVSRQAVQLAGAGEYADLRLGDGLESLEPSELGSVSLTGMGERTILGILERGRTAGKQPAALVVQPNDGAGLLRRWARQGGYWLVAETMAPGFWRYPVLRFELQERAAPDLAYQGLPEEAAIRYGPHLLRQAHPLLLLELRAQLYRLELLETHGRPEVLNELATVRSALDWLDGLAG